MWFDHHLLTDSNEKPPADFKGRYRIAPSAARLVYEYYLEQHPDDPDLLRLERLVDETDRLDAAQLTPDDVENPRDYILLGYTIDSRTGLGSFDDYFRKLVGVAEDDADRGSAAAARGARARRAHPRRGRELQAAC